MNKPSLAAQLMAQSTRPDWAKRDSRGGRRRPLAFGVQGQPLASDRPRQQRFSPLRLFHCLRCHRALRRAPPHRHCPQRQWGPKTAIPAAWPHPSMTRSRCSSRWVGGWFGLLTPFGCQWQPALARLDCGVAAGRSGVRVSFPPPLPPPLLPLPRAVAACADSAAPFLTSFCCSWHTWMQQATRPG